METKYFNIRTHGAISDSIPMDQKLPQRRNTTMHKNRTKDLTKQSPGNQLPCLLSLCNIRPRTTVKNATCITCCCLYHKQLEDKKERQKETNHRQICSSHPPAVSKPRQPTDCSHTNICIYSPSPQISGGLRSSATGMCSAAAPTLQGPQRILESNGQQWFQPSVKATRIALYLSLTPFHAPPPPSLGAILQHSAPPSPYPSQYVTRVRQLAGKPLLWKKLAQLV